MAKQWQLRRGTTVQNDAFTGAVGEVTVDTVKNTLRVHDGNTVGGTELAKKSESYYPDLFDIKWSDHIINNPSWVNADTFSWNDGTTYETAYNHLVNDYRNCKVFSIVRHPSFGANLTYYRDESYDVVHDNVPYYGWSRESEGTYYVVLTESPKPSGLTYVYSNTTFEILWEIYSYNRTKTDTVEQVSVTYYESDDGHKICLATEESNVAALYTATGVAWYYILDTENTRFKLPRSKHNKYAVALPVAISGDNDSAYQSLLVKRASDNQTHTVWFQSPYGVYAANNVEADGATYTSGGYKYTFNSLYADLTQDIDQYKYLYFYMGEFSNVGDRDLNNLLSIIYPVGSLYMGTQTTCPMTLVMSNSTWELVSAGKALWTGNGNNANTTIEAGLPNITGQLTVYSARGSGSNPSGSMYIVSSEKTNGCTLASDPVDRIGIDASRSNAIYGSSNTVQPPAYIVNVWKRIA